MNKKKKRKLIVLKIVFLLILLVAAVNLYFLFAPQFGGNPSKERMEKLAVNSTFNEDKFVNQETTPVLLPGSFGKMLKRQFGKNPGRVPAMPIPSVIPHFRNDSICNDLSLIWLGHSTVIIRIEGLTIITDPVFSKRSSPVSFIGPKRFQTTQNNTIASLPDIDIVLISHDHFDHLDHKTIRKLYPEVKKFFVPLGVRDHLEKWGVPSEKIIEADWWNQSDFSGLQFTCTPARHFSGRRRQDNRTLWCSWVIKGTQKSIFYCGDSGYGNHFKEIGGKYGPFDITLMESGAYGQYWPHIHMQPEESVQAHIDLKGKILLPVHWGGYNLAFHPWKEPVNRLLKKGDEMDTQITTPQIGELVIPGSYIPISNWWSDL